MITASQRKRTCIFCRTREVPFLHSPSSGERPGTPMMIHRAPLQTSKQQTHSRRSMSSSSGNFILIGSAGDEVQPMRKVVTSVWGVQLPLEVDANCTRRARSGRQATSLNSVLADAVHFRRLRLATHHCMPRFRAALPTAWSTKAQMRPTPT